MDNIWSSDFAIVGPTLESYEFCSYIVVICTHRKTTILSMKPLCKPIHNRGFSYVRDVKIAVNKGAYIWLKMEK